MLDRVGKISVAADELGLGHAQARSWAREAGFEPVRGGRRHPRRGEYERLRARGVPQRRATVQAGVNLRTARDWDRGVRKSKNARTYPGGLRVDYAAGTATMGGVTSPAPGLAALEKQLHPRFLTLAEREQVRDLPAPQASRCGRSGGRWGAQARGSAGDPGELGQGRLPAVCGAPSGSGTAAPAEGTQAPGRWPAAGVHRGRAAQAVVTRADMPRSTQGTSRRPEHAGERARPSTRRCMSRAAASPRREAWPGRRALAGPSASPAAALPTTSGSPGSPTRW